MSFLDFLKNLFKKNPSVPTVPQLPAPEPDPHQDDGLGEYGKLFASMVIRDSWKSRAEYAARLIISSKARYQTVEKQVLTPWYIIGLLHLMESECDFRTHLHNGDPLTARTRQVPRGRPVKGNPPFQWEESAVDALQYDHVLPPLNTIDQQLYALERFNGLGYRKRGINSPYLWSGSNHYSKGKFVRDGVWDSNSVSDQVGAAVVLKILKQNGSVA